jgi:small subunit ribosomal protein S1
MSGDRPEDDSFAALFEKAGGRSSVPRWGARPGEVLDGTVVQVGRDAVFVDLGGGRQGYVEGNDLVGPDGSIKAAVGDRMQVRVVRVDPRDGIRVVPTRESAVAAGATVSLGDGTPPGERGPDPVKVAVGQVVSALVARVESYGVFLQIKGTKGAAGRGLAPVAELGVPRATDLRKAFPIGTEMKAKIVDLAEGRMRLSVRALKDDEERAEFEGFRANADKERERPGAARGLGTLGDLLKSKR